MRPGIYFLHMFKHSWLTIETNIYLEAKYDTTAVALQQKLHFYKYVPNS